MASESAHLLAKHLDNLSAAARADRLSDRDSIERFAARREEDAFAALVRRHGPMVLRVCRRILHNSHDAEDVFQATFLALSRKAVSLRRADTVGCWLHGVAYRLAQKARTQFALRHKHESQAAVEKHGDDPLAQLSVREAQAIVDEELSRLPEKIRAPLVLCYLEGRTRDEAAQQLGWSAKLVKSRLEQGRERLRSRLVRRGLTLPAALLATLFSEEAAPAALPAGLVRSAVQIARACPADCISAPIASLAESALSGTITAKAKLVAALLFLTGILAAGFGALALPQSAQKQAETPTTASAQETPQSENQQPARTDRHGDPLPPGALARLGTVRWRHGDQVTAVAFSPDGAIVASGSWDESIHLWDARTGKRLHILRGHGAFIGSVCFTPDGKQIISSGGDSHTAHTARVWDVATGKELRHWPIPGGKLVLSPDGKLLAGSGQRRGDQDTIALWDVSAGKQIREMLFEGVQDSLIDLAFSPDGKRLVCGGGEILRLFDVVAGKQIRTFGAGKRIYSVAFSSDGKTVAVGRWQEPIALWDVVTFKKRRPLDDAIESQCVAFSHNGKTLAGCGFGFAKAVLWDAATGKKLRELPGTFFQVRDIAFSPDDKSLAIGNLDSQVRLWDLTTGKERSSVGDHREWVNWLLLVDHGQGIASASADGAVCHWSLATSEVKRKFQVEETFCLCGDLSPDGRVLALGGSEGVRLFDWPTGKPLHLLKGHKRQVWAAVFSPKGDVLASCANMDQHIILWDVATGKELRRILTAYLHDLSSLAWSPDGKILASAGAKVFDNTPGLFDTVCLWDASAGKELRNWALRPSKGESRGRRLHCIAYSPDGTLLAAADGDDSVVLWDAANGRMRARLIGHQRYVKALTFSPDGRMLASGGMDRTVRLWELSTWKERRRYEGHLGGVTKLTFSADGLTLASGSADTSVLLWSVLDRALAPRSLERVWDDLASEDASRAWRAVCTLVNTPKQSIPFLQEHLMLPSAADLARISRLLADLDSDQFTVRQQAAAELEKLGDKAQSAMLNALENRPSLEVRRRLQSLLEKLDGPVRNAEVVRELRALEVLERTDTAEARTLLRTLAKGKPEARLTRQAKAALDRLTRKPNTAP